MGSARFQIAGADEGFAAALGLAGAPLRCLVNADRHAEAAAIVARCLAFADTITPGEEALIVTILYAAPPGLADYPAHAAAASLWAFTRQAALDWAGRGIRVNAIGLGTPPFGPFEATEHAGRAAADIPSVPASPADIARTLLAMAGFRSMTGQIIRLGQ